MMAVILREQAFPGQLFTKVGKYDVVESGSVVAACNFAALPHGKRNGCGAAFSYRGVRRGPGPQRSAPTRKPPFSLTARVLAASSTFAKPRNATFTTA